MELKTEPRWLEARKITTLIDHNLSFPFDVFERLRAEDLLRKPLSERWGLEPGTHAVVLDVLRYVGGLDLSAGRLYEGHVNALFLVARFGDVASALRDLDAGRIFGVWNTDAPDGVRARREDGRLHFTGRKAFGSGSGTIDRPIVTAEIEGEGRTMCLLPMEFIDPAIDWNSWRPLGMEGSDSFTVDFNGVVTCDKVMLGRVGDYYRQPAFSGGAIRFSAVHFGAVERLAQNFCSWLVDSRRTADPYQLARAGEIAMEVQSGKQWIRYAADMAEQHFLAEAQPGIGNMIHAANMTRLAMERIALNVMERVTRGVGARGLLEPAPFAKTLRDLTMYLRQPAPDQALADAGKHFLST